MGTCLTPSNPAVSANKGERVTIRLSSELDSEVRRMAGGHTSKSAWIEEAIRQRATREVAASADLADLPPAARERVEAYIELVRSAVRDEDTQRLEQAWKRERDEEYYGMRVLVPSTLDASVDVLIGRGSARRVPKSAGCQ